MVKFGRKIGASGPFERFYCLPDSFSAALMGAFTRSEIRVGYRGQMRSMLLTHNRPKVQGLHRVEEYGALLGGAGNVEVGQLSTSLEVGREWIKGAPALPVGKRRIVINVNSEASSRRMSVDKWADVGRALIARLDCRLLLVGAPSETVNTGRLAERIGDKARVVDLAGRTSLPQLAAVLKSADLVVSTDSGSAHLANAVGTPTIVLFGAGDERNTAPHEKANLAVIRVPDLACAPCVSNVCRLGDQRCLERIEAEAVVTEAGRMVG